MRVGDIYFRQMDKPDRDYSDTTHAEEEYRLMIQQFPDSPLVPQAKQRLREVQETLASREADIAAFYASHANWPATIARYQTVIDTYPLYSHMDDVLVNLGDAFETEARFFRTTKLPPSVSAASRERLVSLYEHQAAAAYTKVVLEHSAAAHVEDARDRLVGMGLPIPTPTPEQIAASSALENSRGQYTLSNRVEFLVLHKADTVPAATLGDPPLEDAKPTLAPTVYRQSMSEYYSALNPAAYAPRIPAAAAPLVPSATDSAAPAPAAAAAEPLALQDVPAAGAAADSTAAVSSVSEATPATASGGSSVGIEIVQPSSASPAPTAAPTSPPVFPGAESTAPAQSAPAGESAQPSDNIGGIKPASPAIATITAPIEKPEAAPDTINEAAHGPQPPVQAAPAKGKKPKPAFDKSDESSSKHKKKKGLSKLNPF
jgi:outer membrane protein assembly factor BamD